MRACVQFVCVRVVWWERVTLTRNILINFIEILIFLKRSYHLLIIIIIIIVHSLLYYHYPNCLLYQVMNSVCSKIVIILVLWGEMDCVSVHKNYNK